VALKKEGNGSVPGEVLQAKNRVETHIAKEKGKSWGEELKWG